MEYCPHCDSVIEPNQKRCHNCGKRIVKERVKVKRQRESILGFLFFAILSFFIPPLGFIIFFLMRKTKPITAWACFIVSGLVTLFILFVIIFFFQVLIGILEGLSGFMMLL